MDNPSWRIFISRLNWMPVSRIKFQRVCGLSGLVKTDIGLKHTNWLHTIAWKFRRRKGQSPLEGASTSIYCATEPSIQDISGKYWHEKKVKAVFKSAQET